MKMMTLQCVVRWAALVLPSPRECLCATQINTLTDTQGNRAGTLTETEQNHPFNREQNHRGEDACNAYWYSFQLIFVDTDTLPPGLTQ